MIEKFNNIFLKNRHIKQTMFKNIFWLIVSQSSGILRTFTIFYAARVLGSTEYGTFSYILGLVGLLSIFADLGLSPLLVRDTAGKGLRVKEYFATSFWLKISLVLFTSILFYLFSPYFIHIEQAIYLIPFAIFLIIFDNLRNFIVAYLRGLEKMEWETLIVTILNITLTILGLIVLITRPTAYNFFLIYTISSAVATLMAFFIARKIIKEVIGNFKKDIAKEICRNAWPIALSGTFGIILLNVDIFMLGLFSTAEQIGLYSIGQKITQFLYIVPTLLASGVFPTIASMVKREDTATERSFNEKSIRAVFLFTLPLVAGGVILAEPLLLLFGHGYAGGVPAFKLLLLNTLFLFPGIMITNLVLAHNKQRIIFKYVIISSLINVGLNLLLIPRIGIVGAAISALVSQIINYGFTWYEIRKISNFHVFAHLNKVLFSVTIMGVLSFILDRLGLHVLPNILLSACVYFSLLYILKEQTLQDIKIFIKSSTRKDIVEVGS